MPPKYADDKKDHAHPSVDTSGRFALDALLRKHGWQIWERRRGKDPKWRHHRSGEVLPQRAVVKQLPHRELQDAEYAQRLYYQGKYP